MVSIWIVRGFGRWVAIGLGRFGLGLGGVGIFDPWAVVLFFFERKEFRCFLCSGDSGVWVVFFLEKHKFLKGPHCSRTSSAHRTMLPLE